MFPRAKAPPVKSDTALGMRIRIRFSSRVTRAIGVRPSGEQSDRNAEPDRGLNENEYRWGSKINGIQVANSGESIVKL